MLMEVGLDEEMEAGMADRRASGLSISVSWCLFSCCCFIGCVSGGVAAAWLPGPDRWMETSVSGHAQQQIRAQRDRKTEERMDSDLPPIRSTPPDCVVFEKPKWTWWSDGRIKFWSLSFRWVSDTKQENTWNKDTLMKKQVNLRFWLQTLRKTS